MIDYDNWKEFASARRSSRDFLPDPIAPSDLKEILEDGLTAPSWSNTRPFVIGVAEGEKRDRISNSLITRLRESKDLYMEALMLSAKAKGIGSCAQGYLGNYPDIIRDEFEVGDEYALVCGMSLGFASDHPINSWKANRLPIEELLLNPSDK